MRRFAVPALVVTILGVLAGCGGSGGGSGASSGGGGSGGGGGSLVADVTHTNVDVKGKTVTVSVQVKIGGVAGKHVKLAWGLVDAEQNSYSPVEKPLHAYVSTNKVTQYNAAVKVPLPRTDYLVHFVLNGPGGYLSSKDSDIFGGGG